MLFGLRRIPGSIALAILPIGSASIFGQVNVMTYHNDNMRTGQNLSEALLTPQNVQSATAADQKGAARSPLTTWTEALTRRFASACR
jgi:hypothetical protein